MAEPAAVAVHRGRLAADQAALLAALVAGGPVPAGFDTAGVRAASAALAAKRARLAQRAAAARA